MAGPIRCLLGRVGRSVGPRIRRLVLYLAAAVLIVLAGRGVLLYLPGYIHRGDTGGIVLGALLWGGFLGAAVACLVAAERGGRRPPRR